MVKCHLHTAFGVTRMVSQCPYMAQVWLSGLCMGSHHTELSHTVHPLLQLRDWLSSKSNLCLARPQLHPPSIPGCTWLGGGGLTAPVPSKASLGKLSIQLKLRACCTATCVWELVLFFPAFSYHAGAGQAWANSYRQSSWGA